MNGNRYFLMMTDDTDTRVFYNEEDYKNFLISYSKNNKNSKNQYVYGNFTVLNNDKNSTVIKYTIYKKITKSYDLNIIDKFLTEQVSDQNELKERFKKAIDNGTGKVYIGYMYKGQAKTLPIFYKKDKQYTDYESLKKLMVDKILDKNFLSNIWTNPKLNQTEYRKKISLHLEQIQIEYGKYVINRMSNTDGIKNAVSSFVKAWCTRDGEINQRYVRELGSIVKNIIENAKEKISKKEDQLEIKGKYDEGFKTKKRTKKDDHENMTPLF